MKQYTRRIGYIVLIVNDFILIFFSHFSSLLYLLMEAKLPIIVHRPLTSVHYSFCGFPQKESTFYFPCIYPFFLVAISTALCPAANRACWMKSWIFSQPFQVKIHFITLFFKIFLPFACYIIFSMISGNKHQGGQSQCFGFSVFQ